MAPGNAPKVKHPFPWCPKQCSRAAGRAQHGKHEGFFVGLGSPRELHGCDVPTARFTRCLQTSRCDFNAKTLSKVLEVKAAGEQEEAEGQGAPG